MTNWKIDLCPLQISQKCLKQKIMKDEEYSGVNKEGVPFLSHNRNPERKWVAELVSQLSDVGATKSAILLACPFRLQEDSAISDTVFISGQERGRGSLRILHLFYLGKKSVAYTPSRSSLPSYRLVLSVNHLSTPSSKEGDKAEGVWG